MNRRTVLVIAVLALSTTSFAQRKEVTFKAKDGSTVYGYLTPREVPSQAIVVMFHQAQSSAAEYTPIIPDISKLGFDCLAIDQRSGGGMFGPNKTAKSLRGKKKLAYPDAYQDMEAAIAWAKAKKYKKIVAWGSSYSAALTLRLADEHGKDLVAALAFSPGEYIPPDGSVKKWASHSKVPLFLTATPDEVKESVMSFYAALPKAVQPKSLLWTDVNTVHGSSMLRKDQNPNGYRLAETTVVDWLKKTVPVK